MTIHTVHLNAINTVQMYLKQYTEKQAIQNISKSTGMLSSPVRSRLPNEKSHLNTINTSLLSDQLKEAGCLRTDRVTNLTTYFIEIHVRTSHFTQALYYIESSQCNHLIIGTCTFTLCLL